MAKKKRGRKPAGRGPAKKKVTKKKAAKKTTSKKRTSKKGATRKKSAAGRVRYSAETQREVAEYSILHGIHAAAKKFGVSAPSVTNWRKAFGINRDTKRAAQSGKRVQLATPRASSGSAGRAGYPEDFRREVADYSILHGIQQAAKKFKVSAPSVTNWRRSFGITRAHKREALASVSHAAPAVSASLPKGEVRQVRKQLDQAFRSLDRLLAKLG